MRSYYCRYFESWTSGDAKWDLYLSAECCVEHVATGEKQMQWFQGKRPADVNQNSMLTRQLKAELLDDNDTALMLLSIFHCAESCRIK